MGELLDWGSPIFLLKEVRNMVVVSFDQSTRCSGYTVFENGEYLCSGLVDLSKSKLDTDKRSFEMAKRLWKILKEHQPEHLIIENVQQMSSVQTVIILARLQGMIIGYAEAHNIEVHILQPSQWRSALGYQQGPKVKRAELKQQSIDYAKENYGLDLPEDTAESLCINAAAHIIYNFTEEDDIWGN